MPISTSNAVVVIRFRISLLLNPRKHSLARTLGDFDGVAVAAALRRTVLGLAQVGHGGEQPDPRRHQHHEKAQHYRVLNSAVTLVVRRLRLCHSACYPIMVLADKGERHRNNRQYDS